MYSLIVLWYAISGHRPEIVTQRRIDAPWYLFKADPSFADMLTALRHVIIATRFMPVRPAQPIHAEIRQVQRAWALAAAETSKVERPASPGEIGYSNLHAADLRKRDSPSFLIENMRSSIWQLSCACIEISIAVVSAPNCTWVEPEPPGQRLGGCCQYPSRQDST